MDEIEDAEANILILGIGMSRLAEDMYNDGWTNITAIDFCKPAIDAQLKLRSEGTKVRYRVCDAKNMAMFKSGTFDFVIDKACIDAIITGQTGKMECEEVLQ